MTTQPIPSPTPAELAAEARRNAANARRFADRADAQVNQLTATADRYPMDPLPAATVKLAAYFAHRAQQCADNAQYHATNATNATNPANLASYTIADADDRAIRSANLAAQWSDLANALANLQDHAVTLNQQPHGF